MANPVQLGALSLSPPKPYTPPRVRQDKPAWGVSGKGFFDDKDKYWHPGEMLYFDGEPNTDLLPLNKLAYEKLQSFLDKLDAFSMKKAKKEGKDFIPAPRTVWTDSGEEITIPSPDYVMGVKKEGHNEAIR